MHADLSIQPSRDACRQGAAGCRRCTLQAQECAAPQTALLLACHNHNVRLALIKTLSAGEWSYQECGSFLLLAQVRPRIENVASFLKDHLSVATREAVKGVFVREDAPLEELAQAVCFHAEALPALMERWKDEWARTALAEGWLFSMFQPIVDADTGFAYAYESLIRARNPHTQQIIGAGPLIDACERLQLHHQLDQRARQCAIRGAASLGIPHARFFINFMPNTIYDPEICLRTTMEAAEEAHMGLHRLVFEVVETEDIPDMKRLCHILDYYRSRGVGTAVDDLGAGFASLPYLDALRPDYAKIDRDIVVQAVTEQDARDKLDLIVGTAKSLGIKVIAEGIETAQQLSVCREAGVDLLQGYLFARPAYPPAAISAAISAEHFPALAMAS